VDIPANLRYSRDHEWALIEGEIVTVGITEYAVHELGDVVFIELPEVGDTVDQEAVFGNIESVKAVSELFAPISGEVIEVNGDLIDAPETANEDPYGDAWMVKIEASDPSEFDALLTADQYKAYLAEIKG
jgi:glycine cleavage system H protein